MRANEKEDVIYDQPKSLERRVEVAREFIVRMQYDMEVVVDPIDDAVGLAFAAWPERLYVIDEEGRVAYKGGMGPQGFRVDELEQWLRERLATRSE